MPKPTPLLDTSSMEVVWSIDAGGQVFWHYIDHMRRIATSGFLTRDALERNRGGFIDTENARGLMRARYEHYLAQLPVREALVESRDGHQPHVNVQELILENQRLRAELAALREGSL